MTTKHIDKLESMDSHLVERKHHELNSSELHQKTRHYGVLLEKTNISCFQNLEQTVISQLLTLSPLFQYIYYIKIGLSNVIVGKTTTYLFKIQVACHKKYANYFTDYKITLVPITKLYPHISPTSLYDAYNKKCGGIKLRTNRITYFIQCLSQSQTI